MARATVLVVEDDQAIRRGVSDTLSFAGYRVIEAADGQSAVTTALGAAIDLVLLDILLPGLDGLSVLRQLRTSKATLPVIMLTARGEDGDVVKGLKLGADDYVVKPFSATQLLARIEAVLRRSPERPIGIGELRLAGRSFDPERRELTRADGRKSVLPQREAELLVYLAQHRGRAVSRDELLRHVWGVDPRGVQTRTVDMAVARLREALGDDPENPSVVMTVRGKGYMLVQPTVKAPPMNPPTDRSTDPPAADPEERGP